MKRLLTFLVLLGVMISQSAYSDDTMTLKNEQQILDATAINQAIDLMSKDVMSCVNKKVAPAKECMCLYPENIKKFNTTVKSILDKYPQWENKTVNWQLNNDSMGYNLSIPGLRRQLQMQCQ